jgi:hypothetical protein
MVYRGTVRLTAKCYQTNLCQLNDFAFIIVDQKILRCWVFFALALSLVLFLKIFNYI